MHCCQLFVIIEGETTALPSRSYQPGQHWEGGQPEEPLSSEALLIIPDPFSYHLYFFASGLYYSHQH